MTKNKDSTRYYSHKQEQNVSNALGGVLTSNSGASKFSGGDVIIKDASLLIECKTSMSEKDSFSIKKEWIEKNEKEKFAIRMNNQILCFNFGPDKENYYVINEKLMKFLVNKLREEEQYI